jgi:hypothetical protein
LLDNTTSPICKSEDDAESEAHTHFFAGASGDLSEKGVFGQRCERYSEGNEDEEEGSFHELAIKLKAPSRGQ